MTNGPIERSATPDENPYRKGSARWKIMERRLAEKRKAEAAAAAAAAKAKEEKPKEDTSKRREYLDKQIDG